MRSGPPRLIAVYVGTMSVLLLLPIAIVVILAFSGQSYLKFPPDSLSLRWFVAFFGDEQWRQSLYLSIAIATIASILSTLFGFLAAYAFVRGTFRGKAVLLSLLLMPMIIPTVITSIALYFFSTRFDLIGNIVWIGCCHAIIALPVVLLILLSTLQGVDASFERAALSLGASRWHVFTRIVVPLAAPGLVSATLFAFLVSFDELLIAMFLTNVRDQTLAVRIWNSLHLEVEPTIAAVSAFLIAVTGLFLFADWIIRRRLRAVSWR